MKDRPMEDRTPPLQRSMHRLRAAFWRRRLLNWLVRAAWLILLVPLGMMVAYMWHGWQFSPRQLVYTMIGVGLLVLLWAVRPISLGTMARRLDHRLKLKNRLVTALEVVEGQRSSAEQAGNPVVQRLLRETVETITGLRPQVRLFSPTFWLETRTLVAVAALLTGLIVLNTLRPRLPSTAAIDLPPAWEEPRAEDVLPPDVQLGPPPFEPVVQPPPLSPEQAQAALEALADALRDQAATRAVADALDQGDIGGAANELRRLADRLDQLSEEAQAEIGQALQEAAENIGENAPGLTEPLEAGSEALSQGDGLSAGAALEALAEALEALGEAAPDQIAQQEGEEPGEQPADTAAEPQAEEEGEAAEPGEEQSAEPEEGDNSGGGEGAGDGDGSGQPTEEERLAGEGDPLELESDSDIEDRVLQPAELEAGASDRVTQDSPFARQPANLPGDLGPDPLAYPWEKRDIIRSYFTP